MVVPFFLPKFYLGLNFTSITLLFFVRGDYSHTQGLRCYQVALGAIKNGIDMKKFFFALSAIYSAQGVSAIPQYYENLSQEYHVPTEVIFALAMTETNTALNDGSALPWPYTINLNGKAEFFLTKNEMLDRAHNLLSQGVIHFDCGLFQVNWKWNGRYRASSLDEACDPYSNGRIATDIIKEWYNKTGNWVEAAGRYHNPNNNNGLADVYKRKFSKNLKIAQHRL